ncbi:MAG: sulfatase-like hydrolase/transferase, partial [Planctomycetota bacterium]
MIEPQGPPAGLPRKSGFFGGLLAAITLCWGACGPAGEPTGGKTGGPDSNPQTARPNLILISLDTCRADRLTSYGGREGATPNLDALASQGALFTNCLAQSTATAPSHRSLLTGQYVQRHGLTYNGVAIRPRYTLATIL